jgi:N6-L-threonylcarbamoyladenine synthase
MASPPGPTGSITVLGIETSCDETAAAVVRRTADGRGEILGERIRAQVAEHAPYAGVVPEIAARAHVEIVDRVVAGALEAAGLDLADMDAIAATAGPGLIGGVMVGLTTAKALALVAEKPLYAINHLEGHVLTARLTDGIGFPYLVLLVSGGHTQIVMAEGVGRYRRIGTTIDDALGEAFDKVAKLLGLGFPGGPEVEKAAAGGDPARFDLPRPLSGRRTADFSFSGLKTAIRQTAEGLAPLTGRDVADLCAAFQATVAGIVGERLAEALRRVPRPTALVAAGGVAANGAIRTAIEDLAGDNGLPVVLPPLRLCTDNAAMIAWAGAERAALGHPGHPLDVPARSRWPLDPEAEPALGSGKAGAKA